MACRVFTPRRNGRGPDGLRDPLMLLLETSGGALIDVEVSVNIGYGYDIRCEVVGESGTAALADRAEVVLRRAGQRSGAIPPDWRERFARAYDVELQNSIDAVAAGGSVGPDAWDGYAAAVVADSCLESLRTGERVPVRLGDRPDFYRIKHCR